ncbi:nicotinate-nucleotide--dimethylbenzimidazole phosphoribosyltransferase [Tsuneonella suprasediminis]|uniref:nicotinate-nucleotide--dimethylbenzimidazole phosphoribosyltransferase n=1 Tax=Tsuneonella suprasediminis TaxID=2306996 RepID=UPI001401E33C|nr:nicotinate-nucleotide--dimethylbenzimidazole phosphoribosyltransferase [Tsuneonella suprasediminis]
MITFASPVAFASALADLKAPDCAARSAALSRQRRLTKPAGSLGRLEDIAVFFAGWQGREQPRIQQGRTIVFAGNHGITVHGVSAFPASVTAGMVANFRAGGAAINALSGAAGLDLAVVPLEIERPTADFTQSPAMTEDECLAALNAGAAAVGSDLDTIVLGEMGIGNSTAAAALCARSLGGDAASWVGPGTGIDSAGIDRKVAVVDRALAHHDGAPRSAFETLRRVGGRETAALAGAILRARQLGIPVLLDGFICCSAIAPLFADNPAIVDHCLAGHCSAEPGHERLLGQFGLDPLLRLDMRLGEGSGAAVVAGVVRAALATHNEMATFNEAGIADAL